MMSIPLIGIFDTSSGGTGARVAKADLALTPDSLIRANVKLDPNLLHQARIALDLARAEAMAQGFEAPSTLGAEIELQNASYVKHLRDTSFGVPIYVAALAQLTREKVPSVIAATGSIAPDGSLEAVDEIVAKEDAARSAGYEVLIFPASQTAAVLGNPVATARAAAFFWLGSDYFLRVLDRLNDPEEIAVRFFDFMDGHRHGFYPLAFGHSLTKLAREHPGIEDAFLAHRPQWLLSSLSAAPGLPDEFLEDFCQLLIPHQDYSALWSRSDAGEGFLVESLDALADAAKERPQSVAWATGAFLRAVRRSVDIGQMLGPGSPILHSVVSLQSRLKEHLEQGDPESVTAWREVTRIMTNLQVIGGYGPAPQESTPTLHVDVVFGTEGLRGLGFSFPDHPEVPPCHLSDPVALFDASSTLPIAWRRSDWERSECAMANLPNAGAIFQRFGQHTSFIFPRLGTGHGEDLTVSWEGRTGAWPPSIDTLHLVHELGLRGFYDRESPYTRVLDLGCGTGIHGLLMGKVEGVRHVVFLDLEPGAQLSTSLNVERNFHVLSTSHQTYTRGTSELLHCDEVDAEIFPGHVLDFLPDSAAETDRFDLTICTPPYVPFIRHLQEPAMWRAVSGTDLLRFSLTRWRDFTDRLIIQFSEIALPEVESLLDGGNLVATHTVGFRIPPLAPFFDPKSPEKKLARGQKWLDLVGPHLIDTDSTEIEGPHHGFKYFHRIRTYLFE